MIHQKEYIRQLVQSKNKLSFQDFFRMMHQVFYKDQELFFMDYFLKLVGHEGEFYVHQKKLVDFKLVDSLSNLKKKLDKMGLVEGEDYSERLDMRQHWCDKISFVEGEDYSDLDVRKLQDVTSPSSDTGTDKAVSINKVYMLTPEAFKTCLLRTPRQKIDPEMYFNYYLLLEKIQTLFIDYEKQWLKHHVQKQENIHDTIQDDTISLCEKRQIIYIATNHNDAKRNLFNIGGIDQENKLVSNLASLNDAKEKDKFFYTTIYQVDNYREIEFRLKHVMGGFRHEKFKHGYKCCHDHLVYVLDTIVNNFNHEVDEVYKRLETFINTINKPVPVVPLILTQICRYENSDSVLYADTPEKLVHKLSEHVQKMKTCMVVSKQIGTVNVKNNIKTKHERIERFMCRLMKALK